MPNHRTRSRSPLRASAAARLAALWMGVLAAIAVPTAGVAQQGQIEPFLGQWQGTGVSESEDALFFSMNSRDLDVVIEASGSGFNVDWVTVIQTGDPNAPESERRESAYAFRATDTPGVFSATASGNPLDGEPLAWARLEEGVLTVTILEITGEGGYALSSYERRLDEDGMTLTYYRLVDGETARTVNGRLSRVE